MTMICLRSKFGFCRFGQQCQMTHFSESCVEKSCTGNNCDKRHPIACYFFERFGRCKFGVFCAYRHDKSKEQIQQEEVNSLREEVDVLKKEIIKIKTEKENTFSCDYCDLTYKTEKKLRQHIGKKHEDLDKTVEESEWSEIVKKVENLESKLMELLEKTEVSDSKIKYTSIEVSDISEKVDVLTSVVKEQDTVIIELEEKEETLRNIIKENSEYFHCDKCEFSSISSRGLNIHIAKLHSKIAEHNGKLYSVEKNRKTGYFEMECFICNFKTVYYIEAQHSKERHWLQMREHFQQKHDFMNIENFTEQGHKVGKN